MSTASTSDGATPELPRAGRLVATLRTAAADVKLAHSVFALPFAILASFLVAPTVGTGAGSVPASDAPSGGPIDWVVLGWKLPIIVACMFFARTWAMLFNRIADARIDAANPRTARRAIPAGRMSHGSAWGVAILCVAAFVGCASLFGVVFGNWWPAILAGPVLVWIAFYSLTKRFTALCHVFLGGALAASPLAAAIAVGPEQLGVTPAIWWLSGMVLLWVAGFDVIYALQDLEFDRGAGLHSIPAAVGWRGAIWISRVLHAGALVMLVMAWRADGRLGAVFGAGIAIVGALLVLEHVVLARRGKAGLDMAFFTLNGIVSCVLGLAGVADVIV